MGFFSSPAFQFLNGNGYTSLLWPQVGSDKRFLAYLPLQSASHIVSQSILPFDIYWVRVPSVLYLISGAAFLFLTLKNKGLSLFIAIALVILILNEKSLFETTRATRIEPIIFFFLSGFFYSVSRHKYHIAAVLISILLFSHPNVWPLCLVLFLGICLKFTNHNFSILNILKPNVLWLYPIIGILLFLVSTGFEWNSFVDQFLHQGSDHSASGGILSRFQSHFVSRFWPYYKTQPWISALVYAALGYSIYSLVKRKAKASHIAIITTHLVWLVFLGPFYRYNSILVLLSVFCLADYLMAKGFTIHKWKWQVAVFILVLFSSADVAVRHTMAIVQHSERDPYPVIEWLDNNLPKDEKFIITGSDICYYATADKKNAAYFMYNMPPYKHDFKAFDHHFIVSSRLVNTGEHISSYQVKKSELSKKFNSKTYSTLHLYLIEKASDYEKIVIQMDDESRKEVQSR